MAKGPKETNKRAKMRPLDDVVEEALDAIRQAREFVAGLTFEQFRVDEKRAVQLNDAWK